MNKYFVKTVGTLPLNKEQDQGLHYYGLQIGLIIVDQVYMFYAAGSIKSLS